MNGCETWSLTRYQEGRIEPFGNNCLCRVMGYCWFNHVTNQLLLRETGSRPIAYIGRQRPLRLFHHVAHFPEVDPAYRTVFERDNFGWRRPRCSQSNFTESWWDVLGMGRRPSCRITRRDPRERRHRVDWTTCYCMLKAIY